MQKGGRGTKMIYRPVHRKDGRGGLWLLIQCQVGTRLALPVFTALFRHTSTILRALVGGSTPVCTILVYLTAADIKITLYQFNRSRLFNNGLRSRKLTDAYSSTIQRVGIHSRHIYASLVCTCICNSPHADTCWGRVRG